MQEAIFNTQELVEISCDMVEDLKRRALQAPRGRFRFCLHRSHDDQIQEMLIAAVRGTYFRPHRSESPKTKSYQIISGELVVILFNDAGDVLRRLEMGSVGSGKPFLFRFAEPNWHMPIAQSEVVVYHEVRAGPYSKDVDVVFAPWSPPEGDPAVQLYLEKLLHVERGEA